MDYNQEFDRQTQVLIHKGYPNIDTYLPILKTKIRKIPQIKVDYETGHIPFVIVVKHTVFPTVKAMPGITKLHPLTPEDFRCIESVTIPDSPVYLLIDIDRGKKYLNITPFNALSMISAEKRTPLTIDEGVAIITQYPDFLMKNNCFSLLASRHTGDKRVPAIWINAKKQANLGWCWENNPHTWLGSASCVMRIGI